MTPAQLATLKADILANSDLNSQPNNSDGAFNIAALYNLQAAPDFYVWVGSLDVSEVMQNGFDWTRVDNLTVGKARIWDWMMRTGTLHPNQANVRSGVLAVFSTAGDQATRLAVFSHCQRLATRLEKLLSTGSGTAATEQGVGPATMGFEGQVDYGTIQAARNS